MRALLYTALLSATSLSLAWCPTRNPAPPMTATVLRQQSSSDHEIINVNQSFTKDGTRRKVLSLAVGIGACAIVNPQLSHAAVGTLPEYEDTNVVLQGVTVRVADKSQQEAMIKFMTDAFDAKVLRKRIRGPVEETWLGFGPEQLSIPSNFEIPVSSLALYGGHASIHLVCDERTTAPFYRVGDSAPGTNIAYLQLGLPQYRVSQMVKNGGNVLDAYGYVNVVSPSGLPIRSIVGISPDPIMFVALNCPNKKVDPNPVVSSLDLVYTPAEGAEDTEIGAVMDPLGVPIKFQSVKDFCAEERATR
eukprot:scaffold1131_cov161-Amphora_coffeaeformis.AAC.4